MSVFLSIPDFIFFENSFNSYLHPDINVRQIQNYSVRGICTRWRPGFSWGTRIRQLFWGCSFLKLLWETSPWQFKNQLKTYGVPDTSEHVERTSPSSNPGFQGMTGLIHSVFRYAFTFLKKHKGTPYLNHTHAPCAELELLQNGDGSLQN